MRSRTNKLDSVHPDDREEVVAKWQAVAAESAALGRTMPMTFTFRLQRKDGSYIWVETVSCITPTRCYGLRRCGPCMVPCQHATSVYSRCCPVCTCKQRHQRPQAARGVAQGLLDQHDVRHSTAAHWHPGGCATAGAAAMREGRRGERLPGARHLSVVLYAQLYVRACCA
jgi:hypothetical protein